MKFKVYRISYEIVNTKSDWKATLVGLTLDDVEATLAEYIRKSVQSEITIKGREHICEADLITDGLVEMVNDSLFDEQMKPLIEEKEKLEAEVEKLKAKPEKKTKKAMKKKA